MSEAEAVQEVFGAFHAPILRGWTVYLWTWTLQLSLSSWLGTTAWGRASRFYPLEKGKLYIESGHSRGRVLQL